MENKAHALAAGLFVALLSLLVLAVAAWLTRDTGVRHAYEISTKETVTGLQAQAPVRFRGVDVGKVSRIGFDPKTTGNVLVRMEIDTDAPLTQDTFATLGYQGVTGLAFVQLADEGRPSPALVPDDEAPPRIPLRPGLLQKLEDKGEAILERVEEMSNRVNRVLGDDNQRRWTTSAAPPKAPTGWPSTWTARSPSGWSRRSAKPPSRCAACAARPTRSARPRRSSARWRSA